MSIVSGLEGYIVAAETRKTTGRPAGCAIRVCLEENQALVDTVIQR